MTLPSMLTQLFMLLKSGFFRIITNVQKKIAILAGIALVASPLTYLLLPSYIGARLASMGSQFLFVTGAALMGMFVIRHLVFSRVDIFVGPFLLVIICVGFCIRSSLFFLLPYFSGIDTGWYMASVLWYEKNIVTISDFEELLLGDKRVLITYPWGDIRQYFPPSHEPLFYAISFMLVRLGLPVSSITYIAPLFSSITLVPYYKLVKHLRDHDTSVIATALLSLAPMQFLLMASFYKNVVANFFLLCLFYFILVERGKIAFKSVLFSSLLLATHIPTYLIFICTACIYGLVRKDHPFIQRVLITVVASFFLALVPVWGPSFISEILFYGGPQLRSVLTTVDLSLFAKSLLLVFLPLSPLWLFILLQAKTFHENRFVSSFALAIFVLSLLYIPIYYGLFIDRVVLFLEFPMAMYAAEVLGRSSKRELYTFLLLAWIGYMTYLFAGLSYKPDLLVWGFFSNLIVGLPSPYHPPDTFGWVLSCTLFSTLATFGYLLLKERRLQKNVREEPTR